MTFDPNKSGPVALRLGTRSQGRLPWLKESSRERCKHTQCTQPGIITLLRSWDEAAERSGHLDFFPNHTGAISRAKMAAPVRAGIRMSRLETP